MYCSCFRQSRLSKPSEEVVRIRCILEMQNLSRRAPRAPNPPFQHVVDAELATDLPDIG